MSHHLHEKLSEHKPNSRQLSLFFGTRIQKFVCSSCQGHPSHGGNEAEIFIIAILGGKIAILGEKKILLQYTSANFLWLHSKNRGKCEIYCYKLKLQIINLVND